MTARNGARTDDRAEASRLYRPNVGVVLLNPAGLVWCGRRSPSEGVPADSPHRWQWPQGGVDPGERADAAALRELAEEVGTARAEFLSEAPETALYDFPNGPDGRGYRGQAQRWLAFRFLGEDADFDLDASGDPEFDAWDWRPLEDGPVMAAPFKRPVYEKVVRWFAPLRDTILRAR